MSVPPVNGNGDDPVTQREFNDAMQSVAREFTRASEERGELRDRLDGLEGRMDRLEQVNKDVLDIVRGIDQQLKELKDLPRRVEKLEDDVFKLKMQSTKG